MKILNINLLGLLIFMGLSFSCKKNDTSTVNNTYPGWTIYNTSNSNIPSNSLTAIAIDAEGNKWIGTSINSLIEFDGNFWSEYYGATGFIFYTTYAICITAHDSVWVTTDGGLFELSGADGHLFNSSNNTIPGDNLGPITVDYKGNLWFGCNGVVKYDTGKWTNYNTSNSGLVNNAVLAITCDSLGNKWFGTWGGGVSLFDGTNWTTYNVKNGLASDSINAIVIDAKGIKWFATNRGVSTYDGTNWTTYNISNSGLANNIAICIAIDHSGNKWFGTTTNGYNTKSALSKFDGTNWTTYTAANSGLANNYVTGIAIDAKGNKWFATGGGGLCEFSNN